MNAVVLNVRKLLAGLVVLLSCAAANAALPIQHWVLPSGAKVYLVETNTLPMLDVQIDFDAGGRRDPQGKAGLASMTASETSRGLLPHDPQRGPASPLPAYDAALDENQLGQAWADLGAGFGGGAGNDRMSFTLRTLTDPDLLPRAVALAARQLGEPAFPEAIWARDRERASASIREADTRPAVVAQKRFLPAVYGTHSYGWFATEASLAAISVADMREFYTRHIQACRAKLTLVGAVNRARADEIATALLSRLPNGGARCDPLPPVPEVQPLAQAERIDIPFDAAQAQVLIGQPGYKRIDPDYFPLLVGNYTLGGGGFVSRLSQEVREKRGLSYNMYSYFSPGLHAGAFTVGLQTRPDQAAQAVEVARNVIAGFVRQGPTAAELAAAKDNLVGGFPLLIDSNRKLLTNVANIAWYELPLDYLDTWTRRVQAVTAEQVRAAFQRKLQPDRMVTVILGAKPPSR